MHLLKVLFAILTLLNGFSLAFPLEWPTTPSGLAKRVTKPQPSQLVRRATAGVVPSVDELKTHLNPVDRDGCVFYSNSALDAATKWAKDNGNKKTIFDVDKDGWVGTSARTVNGRQVLDYAPESPMSIPMRQSVLGTPQQWLPDESNPNNDPKSRQYWEAISKAFTLGCSGDSYLVLPYSTVFLGPGSDNIFPRVEYPLITGGSTGVTRILVVEINGGGTVVKGPWEYWPAMCERQPLASGS